MPKSSEIIKIITEKYGHQINLRKNPEILLDIISAIKVELEPDPPEPAVPSTAIAPFGIPWMDSWAANWVLQQQRAGAQSSPEKEFGVIMSQLTELKFRQRLQDIRRFIIENGGIVNEPPDGGPPEPGTPPAGPTSIFGPDGGTPEPGTPEPPDGGPPEPGVPNPPDPGPTGPDAGILRNNPWILYWFVSLNTPFILDMIDAHFTRRLNDLRQHIRKG